jgi:hypothetical protein
MLKIKNRLVKDPLDMVFRPKADAGLLRELNDKAWRQRIQLVYTERIHQVRLEIDAHLRSLRPLDGHGRAGQVRLHPFNKGGCGSGSSPR